LYIEAKKNNQSTAAAQQMAKDARNGDIYYADAVTAEDIAQKYSDVLSSKYVSKNAKEDLKSSSMSAISNSINVKYSNTSAQAASESVANNALEQINKVRKNSNIVSSQGTGNAQVSQPQGNFWKDNGNGLRQIAVPVKDFAQGLGAGVLESLSYGVSRDLEVYYDRDNEIIYLVGKVVGNTATGIISGAGATAGVIISGTGVGAIAGVPAAVYCGTVTVSAAGNAAANVMQIISIASSGGGSSEGTRKTNPLENIKYTDKVKAQMKQGDYHSFPESVDAFGADGKVTQITGGDNVVRTKVEIPGSYQGKEGIFEYIIEPDGVTCNHRLFRPNK
jgi:hypothetical protein